MSKSKLYPLISDLKNLIYSYLSVEEILTIFGDNHISRDKFLEIYPVKFPTIDEASENGHLSVVQYLFRKGIKPTSDSISLASAEGHLSVVQYLFRNGIKPTDDTIEWASECGHLEIVQFLCEYGVEATSYAISVARKNGHLSIVQYLESKI
jgi:hypothetical protein